MKRQQIKELLDTFNNIKPTPEALQAYCQRHGMPAISTDQFEDYVVANEQDERTGKVFKIMMEQVQNLVFVPDFVTAEEQKKMVDHNEQIEYDIIAKMYEFGITYRESDGVVASIASFLDSILKDVSNRNTNMASRALKTLGEEKFGSDDFKLSDMADYLNEKAGNNVSVLEK